MSEPWSAATHAARHGARFNGTVLVEPVTPVGMLSLRGDLSDPAFAKPVSAVTGLPVPGVQEMTSAEDRALAWMSPDELLFLSYSGSVRDLNAALAAKLEGRHHLLLDLSDARVMFRLTGPGWRDVLAKLTPADLSPGAFGAGQIRRSRLAQVPAAIWMENDRTANVICFRSVASYVFDLLCTSATPGSAVGFF